MQDVLGHPFLVDAREIREITEEAGRNSWSARFTDRALAERVDERDAHLLVPFIDNGPGESGVPSYRSSLWYKVAGARNRARVVIDVGAARFGHFRRPSVKQLERLVAMLVEEVEPEFLAKE